MPLQIGDIAPDFTAESTQGTIRFHEHLGGRWGLFFSHFADFTPVCTTELVQVAGLEPDLADRGVRPVGISTDTVSVHRAWLEEIARSHGTAIDFPVLADPDRSVARLYGMISTTKPEHTNRTVMLIDPELRIRLVITYPETTGRDFTEVLRVIDSLQLSAQHQVVTPAAWLPGDEVAIPNSVSDEEAAERFPDGIRRVSPYVRLAPQPKR